MSTITAIEVLTAKLPNGAELPLRAQVAKKSGNTYWAALARRADGSRYFNSRGVKVKASVLGGSMPAAGEKLTILGSELTFQSREAKSTSVVAEGTIMVSGHGKKVCKVIITDVGEGDYNVTASVRGQGRGGSHPLDEL